ncbi:uncharacterized protein LOC118150887 isoform X5 [Callithrix jacchus]
MCGLHGLLGRERGVQCSLVRLLLGPLPRPGVPAPPKRAEAGVGRGRAGAARAEPAGRLPSPAPFGSFRAPPYTAQGCQSRCRRYRPRAALGRASLRALGAPWPAGPRWRCCCSSACSALWWPPRVRDFDLADALDEPVSPPRAQCISILLSELPVKNPPRSQTQVISMMGTAMTDTTHPGPGHLQVHTSGCAYAHVSTGVCLGGDHHLGHASSEGNMAAKIVSPIVSVVVVTLLGAAASYFRLNSRRNCFRTRDKGLLCLPGWSTIG